MSHMTFLCPSRRPSNHTQDVHLHVMQCPHQQQRMTRQNFRIPCHFNRGPRDTPRQQGCNVHISNNEWHIINFAFHVISTRVHVTPHVSKGTNEKIDVVALPAKNLLVWSPRALTWRLWKTSFYVTSHKNMLKLAMFLHVYATFFPVWYDGF